MYITIPAAAKTAMNRLAKNGLCVVSDTGNITFLDSDITFSFQVGNMPMIPRSVAIPASSLHNATAYSVEGSKVIIEKGIVQKSVEGEILEGDTAPKNSVESHIKITPKTRLALKVFVSALAKDSFYPALDTACFEVEKDGVTAYATDRRRIARMTFNGSPAIESSYKALMGRALSSFLTRAGLAEVVIGDAVSSLIFPNYVISAPNSTVDYPSKLETFFKENGETLLSGPISKIASTAKSLESRYVTFSKEGIYADDSSVVTGAYDWSAFFPEIAFNSSYLLDFMAPFAGYDAELKMTGKRESEKAPVFSIDKDFDGATLDYVLCHVMDENTHDGSFVEAVDVPVKPWGKSRAGKKSKKDSAKKAVSHEVAPVEEISPAPGPISAEEAAPVQPAKEVVSPLPPENEVTKGSNAASIMLDSGDGLNAKDRAARLAPQITEPGVYRLSHVVEINPVRLIVEDNAIYWGYEADGEINPVQGLQPFEIAGDVTAALTKALKKFKAANAAAKKLAGWRAYA